MNFRSCIVLSTLAIAAAAPSHAVAAPVLQPDVTIELPSSRGKFDFLEIDAQSHRLLAAHEKDGTADFFDLNTNKLITRLPLGTVVHIIPDNATGRYFVSAQEEKIVVVLDAETFKEAARVTLDGELDALVLVPKHRRVYAAHDNGAHLWAINADTCKVVGEVVIPGAPEIMAYDAATDRIFLNIKTTNEVVVIDPATDKITARWPTAPAASPHGLVVDAARSRIYVAGGNGKIVAIDTKSGAVVSTADIASTVDQAAFDAKAGRIYCAGAEQMSVVDVSDSGLKTLGHIATNATARNVAVDTATGAVWSTFTDGQKSYAQSWKQP